MANVNTATEQFGNFSKSAIDAAMKFATASFTNAERVIALNLEATRKVEEVKCPLVSVHRLGDFVGSDCDDLGEMELVARCVVAQDLVERC